VQVIIVAAHTRARRFVEIDAQRAYVGSRAFDQVRAQRAKCDDDGDDDDFEVI
jgi:hypothetical protein